MGGVTGVPTKFVAGTNVTAPVEVFTVYVPSVVVRVVAVQSGADCPAEHSRTLVAWMVAVPVEVYPTSPAVVPPESFAVGVKVTDCPKSALPVSFVACATGGGRTVGVIVAEPNRPRLSWAT